MSRTVVARGVLASALAVALTACGGGGGGSAVRTDPPPTTPPPTTPPPTTPPPAPDPLAGYRAPEPTQPTVDAHLRHINVGAAASAGVTGAGIRIGVVDSGVNRNYPALSGRVVANYTYVDPAKNNLAVDDVVGHGTVVAALAAGRAVGPLPGGVAPGAQIVSARIIADTRPEDDGSGDGNEVDGALGLTQVHNALIAQGVRIMNNSWGGLYWTNPAATSAIANEYRPFITGNNGLVVFATGNETKTNPSDMAALPSQPGLGGTFPAADLERGWLAVTAVDSTDPTKLASYANACGVAANYCLAAPGTTVYLDAKATSSASTDYLWGYGTSYAAPLVSGAAALVWQRHPYMSNDLVRQTLLGTATDLGDPGVDPVFGYGLLNVGKAINGPARFDWGDAVVQIDQLGLGIEWRNDISGSGGLIKRGNGGLNLFGTNTYTGDTRIERGPLVLRDGASLTSNVYIAARTDAGSASLGFQGIGSVVHGNVDNAGLILNTFDGATATIDGNYIQRSTGTLLHAMGGSTLRVTGTATLEDGSALSVTKLAPGFVPRDGAVHDVLVAEQGLNGTFAVGFGPDFALMSVEARYDDTTVWLDMVRADVTAAASTARVSTAGMAAAQRVESAFAYLDAEYRTLDGASAEFATAAGELQQVQGGTALAASLDSLSGRAHGQAMQMSLDMIDMNRRVLAGQLQQLRAGDTLQAGWGTSLGEAGQGATGRGGQVARGWMTGQTLLHDGPLQMGYALSHTEAGSDSDWGSDRARDRHAQLQLYSAWNGTNSYVLGQAALGQSSRRIDRQLLLGAAALGVEARQQSQFDSMALEAGYRFGDQYAGLTPYLGVSRITLHNDGLTERGGAGFGLQLADSDIRRDQALAGLRGQRQWRNWGVQGYLEWQQQLGAQGAQWASFTALQDWSPLAQAPWERSSGLFGLSLSGRVGRDGQLSFGYDQRIGGDGARLLQLGYRQAF